MCRRYFVLLILFANSILQVMNLESVEENEINVFVGGELCRELSKNADNVCGRVGMEGGGREGGGMEGERGGEGGKE